MRTAINEARAGLTPLFSKGVNIVVDCGNTHVDAPEQEHDHFICAARKLSAVAEREDVKVV